MLAFSPAGAEGGLQGSCQGALRVFTETCGQEKVREAKEVRGEVTGSGALVMSDMY